MISTEPMNDFLCYLTEHVDDVMLPNLLMMLCYITF